MGKRIRRKIEVEKTSQARGSIDHLLRTTSRTNTRANVTLPTHTTIHQYNTPHTHTQAHTHQYKRIVCFALFLKLGDTVCNTVWNLYISMLPIYIYLYKSHIYT